MRMWFSSLWEREESASCLSIKIHRRDTIVYQKQLNGTHTFFIGRSARNQCMVDVPSLEVERFPFVRFRGKRPFVQLMESMRGTLIWEGKILSFEEVQRLPIVESAPHGYRFEMPEGAVLNLFLDGLLFRLEWDTPKHVFPWDKQMPLTPSRPDLLSV